MVLPSPVKKRDLVEQLKKFFPRRIIVRLNRRWRTSVPALFIYSLVKVISLIINIYDYFTSVMLTGVFYFINSLVLLLVIGAGMDVLQSFFGGRLLTTHIRPLTSVQSIQNTVNSYKYINSDVERDGRARKFSSGEDISVCLPICFHMNDKADYRLEVKGLKLLVISYQSLVNGAGAVVLQNILRGKMLWNTVTRPVLSVERDGRARKFSSGEDISVCLPICFHKVSGLAWMSSISSGEDTSAPASPAISERAGYRLLGRAWMSFKIFFGGRYLLTPSRLRKSFGGQARYLSNSAERSMKDSYLK